jgi:hypothetical protein
MIGDTAVLGMRLTVRNGLKPTFSLTCRRALISRLSFSSRRGVFASTRDPPGNTAPDTSNDTVHRRFHDVSVVRQIPAQVAITGPRKGAARSDMAASRTCRQI